MYESEVMKKSKWFFQLFTPKNRLNWGSSTLKRVLYLRNVNWKIQKEQSRLKPKITQIPHKILKNIKEKRGQTKNFAVQLVP